MQHRFPGSGSALAVSLTLLTAACGGASMKAEAAMAPGMPAPAAPPPAMPADEAMRSNEMAAAPEAAPAPMAAGAPGVAAAAPAVATGGAAPATSGAVVAPTREMLDIEANVTIQVGKVRDAVRSLHQLAAKSGGVITNEHVDTSSTYGSAEITLRVPSASTQDVFEQLDKLGNVLNQNVTARDIGKEFFDGNLRLASLETTLHRYEEILKRADKVDEIMRVEQELGRIRAEIEQLKGNLRWLSDRAARATLHVTLRENVPQIVEAPPLPEAKFYPGLRLPALIDVGKASTQGYFGGGFSLRFSRAASLDLDLFKRPESHTRGVDALMASVGGEIFSDLLHGGERRYLNPYLGWRAGYARFGKDNQAMIGATVGLELYKNNWFGLDLEARNYLVFVGDRGPHYALSPALAARVAF